MRVIQMNADSSAVFHLLSLSGAVWANEMGDEYAELS